MADKELFKGSRRMVSLVLVSLMIAVGFFTVLLPDDVSAETKPGGTLKNDRAARIYTQGWWWQTIPDDLQFKVPTKTNYYTSVAILNRQTGEDFDLFAFDDYDMTKMIASSTKGADEIDMVVIDGHTYGGGYKYIRASKFTGQDWTNGITIESDYHCVLADLYGSDPDANGPLEVGTYRYSLFEDHGTATYTGTLRGDLPLINMYDIYLYSGGKYSFDLDSVPATEKLSMHLFKGSGNLDSALASDVASTTGESLSFSFNPEATGWYGLAVMDQNKGVSATDSYRILVSSDFSMSATPTSRLIAPGMNASFRVDVTSYGPTKDINLHYRWRSATANVSTPTGAIAKLNVNKVTPSGVDVKPAYLNITTTTSLAAGTYYLAVYGNDTGQNGKTHYAIVTLRVSTSPDFFLTTTPDIRYVSPGTSAKYQVSLATINSFTSNISLSGSSSPSSSAISFSFSPSQINSNSHLSNLTVSTTTAATVGLYSIAITGTGGSLTRYGNTSLRIVEPISVDLIAPAEDELVAGVYTFKVKAGTPTDTNAVKITFGGKMLGAGTLNMYYSAASGFWERAVNTYTFLDGPCTLSISAEDNAGGTTSYGPVNFTLSNSAPNPIIKTPLDRAYVTGKAMSIIVNTTSYVISCRFKVDQNAWIALTRSGNTWSGTYDTTQINDGQHSLTIDAKDTAGLTGESTITIFVDNTKPTCTLNSPIDGQYIEGSYTFRIVATDTVGVDHVDITVFGKTVTLPYNPVTSSYEYTVLTTTMSDGTFTVYGTTYDKVNLSKQSDVVTFNIDNNAPGLSINAPTDGAIIGGMYTISATSSDLFMNSVKFKVDSTGWQNLTGADETWSVLLNTTMLTDGPHVLTVKALDNASHETEQAIDFIVDNTNPTCNVVSPFEGAFVEGVHIFRVSATDTVGIDKVVVEVFSDSVQTSLNRQNGFYEYSMNTLVVPDGTYTGAAVSYDLSGKSTRSANVTFKVDNNPPEMTVNNLQNGNYVSGLFVFDITVGDAFLKDVRFSVDGGGWTNTSSPWNTTMFLDGAHTVTVQARDQAGHSAEQVITVTVDNHVPVCAVNGPVPSEFIQGAYRFRLSASDEVGIDRVEINVFGNDFTAIFTSSSGYYEFLSDTSIQSDGNYSCYAIAYDMSGKITVSDPVPFQVDNNAPVLFILHPLDGAFLEGMESMVVNATDIYLDRVEYNIDGSGWVPADQMLNTTIYGDGAHVIQFRAFDLAGHVTSTYSNVIIDNTDPYGAISEPARDQYVDGITVFTAVAADLVGIKSVSIEVFGETVEMNYNALTGYYEFRTDTRLIPDGTYLVNVTVTDLSGKVVSIGPMPFHIDNNEPELAVMDLTNGDILEGSTYLNVIASDTFLYRVEYQLDATGWVDVNEPLNTTIYGDGAHKLKVRASDLSGKETMFEFDVLIDNIGPICTITSPVEDEFVEGVITIRVTAYDLVQVDYVLIRVYDIVARVPYNAQTGYYEYTSNTITWGSGEDGVRNVTAIAYDLTGKSYSFGPVNFNVDNRAPTINIVSPQEGQIISGLFFFDVTNGDVFKKGTDYNVDGASWQPVSIGWNTVLVSDGDHKITIRATDLAGHVTTEIFTVIVDNHAPEVTIASPTENEFLEMTYTFRAAAVDEVGLEIVSMKIAGKERFLSYNTQTGYYEFMLDTRTLADGTYYVNATALDLSGKTTKTGNLIFRVDNNAPDLTVESPVKDQLVSDLFVIRAKASDTFPGLVRYAVDGASWFEITTPWNTSKVADGPHTITVRTIDQAGHITEYDIQVIVDNTDPVISQASITPGQVLAGVQTLRFYVYDSIGVRQVMLSLDGSTPFEIFRGEAGIYYEFLLDTRILSDGDHTLTVTAYDRSDNSLTSTYGIKVDNTGPSITLRYYWIVNDEQVSLGEVREGRSVVFEANVTDPSGVASVFINIDSSGWREMTPDANASHPNTYVLFWPTTGAGKGAHIFQIRTADKLGNEMSMSGLINVKEVEDKDTFFESFKKALPFIWLFLFILLIIAVIVLAYTGILTKWAKGEGMAKKDKPEKDGPKTAANPFKSEKAPENEVDEWPPEDEEGQ